MFSKLQLWILAASILITGVIFAVFLPWGRMQHTGSAKSDTPTVRPVSVEEQSPRPVAANRVAREPRKPSPGTHSDSEQDKVIDVTMEKLGTALQSRDYTYAIEVMYEPVLKKIGGREKGMEMTRVLAEQMKALNVDMQLWKTIKPYEYVEGKGRLYAIIPTELVMNVDGKKIRQYSYQLGIKTEGTDWRYLTGDNLTSEMFEEFFPDFPSTVELPDVEQFEE